ncbi:hypothetical protein QF050_003086 [Arthrobacter sp. SLBN-112]|nr:hypothetical protein [Arthrobacter sp. SLBN-112]
MSVPVLDAVISEVPTRISLMPPCMAVIWPDKAFRVAPFPGGGAVIGSQQLVMLGKQDEHQQAGT